MSQIWKIVNWQKVGERLDEAIAQRKADLDAAEAIKRKDN